MCREFTKYRNAARWPKSTSDEEMAMSRYREFGAEERVRLATLCYQNFWLPTLG